ncbi:MAG: aminoglycoside phosphotransferase family protein [Acidimicrobiales bacterium]
MLLERLGPTLHEFGLPIAERHAIMSDAGMRLWRPVPDLGLPTGAEKAAWLAEFITSTWESLDCPCTTAAIDAALAALERRIAAHDDERSVLVHGDIHQWNALLGSDGGFKLVDPDGLSAEPAYDLGVLLREDPVELLQGDPLDRARWLAARTGVDGGAIWDWGLAERVSTGLLLRSIDEEPIGSQMLLAADAVAALRFSE